MKRYLLDDSHLDVTLRELLEGVARPEAEREEMVIESAGPLPVPLFDLTVSADGDILLFTRSRTDG